MRQFEIKFKGGRRDLTQLRFDVDGNQATISAKKALEDEYYGKAQLISVEEIGK